MEPARVINWLRKRVAFKGGNNESRARDLRAAMSETPERLTELALHFFRTVPLDKNRWLSWHRFRETMLFELNADALLDLALAELLAEAPGSDRRVFLYDIAFSLCYQATEPQASRRALGQRLLLRRRTAAHRGRGVYRAPCKRCRGHQPHGSGGHGRHPGLSLGHVLSAGEGASCAGPRGLRCGSRTRDGRLLAPHHGAVIAIEMTDAVSLALDFVAVDRLPHELNALHRFWSVVGKHGREPLRGRLVLAFCFGGLSRSRSSLIKTALASTRKPSIPLSSQKRITCAIAARTSGLRQFKSGCSTRNE